MADTPLTLAEKVWRDHVVKQGENGEPDLIFIDFQLLHELSLIHISEPTRRS